MDQLAGILERLERLEAENAALRREMSGSRTGVTDEPTASLAGPAPVGRRQVLRKAAMVVATGAGMAAVSGLLSAGRAAAAPAPVALGDFNDAGDLTTTIHSASGVGVQGESETSFGVYGTSISDIGVLGNSVSGRAVVGVASADTGSGIGVMGESMSSAGTGVRGWAAGGSTGVLGFSGGSGVPTPLARTGVYGRADEGAGAVGVRGASSAGRGGLFSGKKAQLQLRASRADTHPSSGVKGDLFVDKSGRLWFCKGGTTWTKLA